MKRYTEKTNNLRDKGKYEYTMISDERQYWSYVDKDGVSLHDQIIRSAFEKLGKLEDIEEELGIDLITLFKAMKDGVYISDGHNNIEYQSPSFLRFTDCFFQIETDDGLYDSIHLYKDYGKTWALTKEELE